MDGPGAVLSEDAEQKSVLERTVSSVSQSLG